MEAKAEEVVVDPNGFGCIDLTEEHNSLIEKMKNNEISEIVYNPTEDFLHRNSPTLSFNFKKDYFAVNLENSTLNAQNYVLKELKVKLGL